MSDLRDYEGPDEQLRAFDQTGFGGDDGSVSYALAAARSMVALALTRGQLGPERRTIDDQLRNRLVDIIGALCQLHQDWPIVPNPRVYGAQDG